MEIVAIEWSPSYETGEMRIDRQHRTLFDRVNRLERMLEAGEVLDQDEVENLLIFLESYINTHFAYEELCMTLRGCPIARKNKEAHDKLLAFYNDFAQRYAARGKADVAMLRELHEVLSKWLVGHVCNIDVRLRNHVPAGGL
ncbi:MULTISPECIES: bacteriohemerythrin [unclassified Meiothermus]|uniref:bacteriohemerythrin n=1 Tax=unclassified Meiothermus TaxID=370471 RepID=UPI001F2D7580|nr:MULTISPECIES: hemerythrin family protein [unclassified Meiothermus]